MKNILVVGSGAGGATVARELQKYFQVTILEKGKNYSPLKLNINLLAKLKKTGLFFDERLIQLIYPFMKIDKSQNGMVVVSGQGTGGATTLSTGTAIRADNDLKKIGINLDYEFEELYQDIPITCEHINKWSDTSKEVYTICDNMNLDPEPAPKMGKYNKCYGCGRCIIGCNNVKWDSRFFLKEALKEGANLITNCYVEKVIIDNKKNAVTGVKVKKGFKSKIYHADLVILAAGGLGTPVILNNSGISCKNTLFVDPVLCVAAKKEGSWQNKEISMPFIIKKDNFIISPYFDYLSFFFNKEWKYHARDIISLMIKLADTNKGCITDDKIIKELSAEDKLNLNIAKNLCCDILSHLGIKKEDIFLGTINAGHPGGMMPLTAAEKGSLHNTILPDNLYIADSTLLPKSTGKPLILTLMALAKKISKRCLNYLQENKKKATS